MTPAPTERPDLDAIKERFKRLHVASENERLTYRELIEVVSGPLWSDLPKLIAEVERLRAALAASREAQPPQPPEAALRGAPKGVMPSGPGTFVEPTSSTDNDGTTSVHAGVTHPAKNTSALHGAAQGTPQDADRNERIAAAFNALETWSVDDPLSPFVGCEVVSKADALHALIAIAEPAESHPSLPASGPLPDAVGIWSNETACGNCGERFGLHYGDECQKGSTRFALPPLPVSGEAQPPQLPPEQVQLLAWCATNCHMLARRALARSTSPFDREKWEHVLRICEKAGARSQGVLRASLPTEITDGSGLEK